MSWASSERTRASMRGNRRRDTIPELTVRHLVHGAGLRYRVDYPPLASHRRLKADLVFTRSRVAVFVDGCFWHGCPEHYVPSKTHTDYWGPKIAANIDRDSRSTDLLVAAGWTVLRFWAHEPASDIAARVIAAVRATRAGSPGADPHGCGTEPGLRG